MKPSQTSIIKTLIRRVSATGIVLLLLAGCSADNRGENNKPAVNPYYGARSWMNTPRIPVIDEKIANELALRYLNSGADGILFEPLKANIQWNVLLNHIKPEFCPLSLLIRGDFSQSGFDFKNWVDKEQIYNLITGSIYWEALPNADLKKNLSNFSPNYSKNYGYI